MGRLQTWLSRQVRLQLPPLGQSRHLELALTAEMSPPAGVEDPMQHGRGVALADFNRDGRTDIVYGNWNGPHRLFMQMNNRKQKFKVGLDQEDHPFLLRISQRVITSLANG